MREIFLAKGLGVLLVALTPGCLAAQTRAGYSEVLRASEAEPPVPDAAVDAPTGAEEAQLAQEARLDTIMRLALSRNPDLLEARERVRAVAERVPAAARLPDLEFKYEQWGVPLGRPYALSDAQTLMFGLRQTFPALGSLDARSRVALEESQIALTARDARVQDIIAQVRRAYYAYYGADREYRIHLDHVDIAARIVDLARANYRAGRGSQQDVLRAIVELSRLHNDIAAIEQERKSSRVLLNTLMARAPDEPLGAPPDFEPSQVAARMDELENILTTKRPELVAAGRAVQRSEAALDVARSIAHWPSLMVGADYWYMPASEAPHAYGAMLSINLPWLNPAHRDEIREAEHTLAADRRALESTRNVALYQLRDAQARVEAARQSFTIIDRDLLAQAKQSYEAAQAAFAAGRSDALSLFDALRSCLQVRLERSRALARLETSLGDLGRAVGAEVGRVPAQPGGEHHE